VESKTIDSDADPIQDLNGDENKKIAQGFIFRE
jgi:hypothetical protein